MKLHIIGSSSSGNAYAFESENQTLLLEAGVRFSQVKKALNFDISKIVGCLLTHEHGDHSKYVKDILSSGIDVFASLGTIKAIGIDHHRFSRAKHGETFNVGEFKIKPFDVKHDCAEPFGYLIFHPEMGLTLFLTDSYFVEYKFPGLNNILIEANYSEDILIEREQSGSIHPSVAMRVRSSHMELSTLKSMLTANDLKKVNQIILLHLSSGNSDSVRFQREVFELTGKETTIASKGLTLQFNKQQF